MSTEDNRDSKRNPSLNLMARRLGVFYPGPPVHSPQESSNDKVVTSLEGVYHQSELLNNAGGHAQQERMIYDKKRSLDRALRYSYQGADIKDIQAEEDELPCRALINPNKVKQDYDDKIVSCNWEYGLKPGRVFSWLGTNTYWIIYLQDLTELAYFKGNIRKCSHSIKWINKETGEIQSLFAAVRGPAETKINNIAKSGNSIDLPNYSLSILIPKTADSLSYFKRYTKFYMQSMYEEEQDDIKQASPDVCWKVESLDWISMPGVIEIIAEEYYGNDDLDENGIPDYKQIIDKISKEQNNSIMTLELGPSIIGDNFIKPKIPYSYTCSKPGDWKIEGDNCPIQILSKTDAKIQIKWDKFYSGQFVLKCGSAEKIIVVETLY